MEDVERGVKLYTAIRQYTENVDRKPKIKNLWKTSIYWGRPYTKKIDLQEILENLLETYATLLTKTSSETCRIVRYIELEYTSNIWPM